MRLSPQLSGQLDQLFFQQGFLFQQHLGAAFEHCPVGFQDAVGFANVSSMIVRTEASICWAVESLNLTTVDAVPAAD